MNVGLVVVIVAVSSVAGSGAGELNQEEFVERFGDADE